MSTKDNLAIKERNNCCICGNEAKLALDLPKLPLTGLFSREKPRQIMKGFDQTFLFCEPCNHGQLGKLVNPTLIYDETYSFRTSMSNTARKGTEFFINCLNEITGGRKFQGILDLGCNDLYLLKQIKARAKLNIGIDPVWQGREWECDDPDLRILGTTIEAAELGDFQRQIDLVVSRHTLEHIVDPRPVLNKLYASTGPEALFLFEFPSFEGIFGRFRFDQIFHQHMQYFSLQSFCRLLESMDLQFLGTWSNYHDWGAMVVAFTKKTGNHGATPEFQGLTLEAIQQRIDIFRKQIAVTAAMLKAVHDEPLYGYGAAQMLPVLAYHLKTDLAMLQGILDDDPAKDGLYYQNMPLRIQSSVSAGKLNDATILVTAFDNIVPILKKLLAERPKQIIVPLQIL